MSSDLEADFGVASAAYEQGDHETAFRIFLRLATVNREPSAMSMVSLMYGSGEGVPLDLQLAVAWGERAATEGVTSALINLGVLFRSRGDLRSAKLWFERALEKGDGEAALELAKLFLVSELERERVKDYLRMAVEKGNLSRDSLDEIKALLKELS